MSDDEQEVRKLNFGLDDDEAEEDNEEEKDNPNDFEDDEDEDEEDLDEEDDDNASRPKKKKKIANPFIDEFADVDDGDDDDEQDDDEEDGYEREADFDPALEKSYLSEDRHRKLDRKRREEEEVNLDQLAQDLKERYGGRSGYNREYQGDLEHVPQRLLIPSVNDPKLWLVKCKIGKEKDTVFNIMRKYFDLLNTDRRIEIYSCFARESLPGYVYIEAEKQIHVNDAIQNCNTLYATQKLQLVPVNEMVDCLTVKKRDVELKVGGWVRIKKGKKYSGDLAQIYDLAGDTGETAILKIIPRIDYTKGTQQNEREDPNLKRKKVARPAAKLFSPDFVLQKSALGRTQIGYTFQGEQFNKSGYMLKELKTSVFTTENVNPSLEEITNFSGNAIGESKNNLAFLAEANIHSVEDFEVGENVEVVSGELANLPGVVLSVENGIVTVKSSNIGLDKALQFPAKQLRKRFSEGEHVKVCNGVHKDETGMILNIFGNVATVLSDSSMKSFEVFIRDMRLSADINASGGVPTGKYDVYDLVQINQNEVGVVTKFEENLLSILNQFGTIQRVRTNNVLKKIETKRAATTDSQGEPCQSNDSVVISDPILHDNKKRGTVLHIYRNYIFVRSREIIENAGVLVSKNTYVTVLGGKKANPANGRGGFVAPQGRGGFGGGRGGRGGGRGRGYGRDPLMNKTVAICGGPYKGYIGIVKDVQGEIARVELHTTYKIISIDRNKLQIPGQNGMDSGRNNSGDHRNAPFGERRNNFDDNYGNRSRGFGDGSRTPGYSGNKTPAWNNNNSGSKTPAWDSGSKTPAWDSGSKTPAWDSGSKTPAWDSGSKTPAWDAGNKTPAWDANNTSYQSSSKKPAWESTYSSALADTPGPDTPYQTDVTTPYGHNPATPNPSTPYHAPQTPSAHYHTPGNNSSTPFHPSTPYDPATPQHNAFGTTTTAPFQKFLKHEVVNWTVVDVEVQVQPDSSQNSFRNGKYDGDKGVIDAIENGGEMLKVFLYDQQETFLIPKSNLIPVIPEIREDVLVTGGDNFEGQIGQLATTDDHQGVVKLRSNERAIDVFPLRFLAKYGRR
ncbi:transcription elongation factor spt5 [Clydaea vesicula]|uniref:Transcription elongation factor SPT5 n=1 Tax=Clydaea vesicula TaxID=447962 RepID=A0AAD5XXM1_9FUNG|nr:transcription elongation factor spt5 [Clydaea vesicula]KAJ3387475.1 transcription elongation factor spt5 [Lobulomyces angularis]